MVLDCKELIKEIRERRPLWNKSFSLPNVYVVLWKEISTKLGAPDVLLQKKWLSLKHTFRKELKRQNDLKEANPNAKITSKWKYYNDMCFMEDILKNEILTVAIESDSILVKVEPEDINGQYISCNNSVDPEMNIKEDSKEFDMNMVSCNLPALVDLLTSFRKDVSQLEKEKAAVVASQSDEDLVFFQSLLPYMRSLDMNRKLILRTKIQQYVCDYIYGGVQ